MENLNSDQEKVFNDLVDHVMVGDGNVLISGVAGTGKTYLSSLFVSWYRENFGKILIMAPTHKALKVLKEKIPEMAGVNFKTVHSALGMKEQVSRNGDIYFSVDLNSFSIVDKYSLCLVDEASMLNSQLYDILVECKTNIVFVGDPKQIPPVKESESPVFGDKNIKALSLNKIVRQAEGNPIIDMASFVRENLLNDFKITDFFKLDNRFQLEENSIDIENRLKDWFVSDEFQKDADYAKVVAWRNATVDSYNSIIRRLLYGDGSKARIVCGEKLIANNPIKDEDDNIIINNNGEMVVESFEETKKYGYPCYEVNVKSEKRDFLIYVLHESGVDDFNKKSDKLKDDAICAVGQAKKKAWYLYYKHFRTFADVKYNYALTAHKSQGSTYQNVMVIEYDIDANRKIEERNRIKYTALTRAAKQVVLVN